MRLLHGDCLVEMAKMESGSVDMVLADIPYGVVNRHSNGLRNLDKKGADEETFDIDMMLEHVLRVCSGSVYIFCATEQVSRIRQFMDSRGLTTRLCILEKTNPSPMNGQYCWLSNVECFVYGKKPKATFNEHCKGTVFRSPSQRNKLHPTQKPLELMERLVSASTNKNNTVLDFCMGSGTTGVACVNLGRKFIGIENDAEYFAIAKDRIDRAAKQ